MQDFHDVRARVAGGGKGEPRGSAGRHRRDEAGELVVVEQHPAALQLAPADTLDFDRDECADRPAVRGEPRRHVEPEGGLGQQPIALLHDDVVQKPEVFRRDEGRGDATVLVALHRRDPIGDRSVVATVVLGDRDLPAPFHGTPDQLEFAFRRKALSGHGQRRARRAVLRGDAEASDIAADGLGR